MLCYIANPLRDLYRGGVRKTPHTQGILLCVMNSII